MPEIFKDKTGSLLETGLYNLSILEWPMTFQRYASIYWGNFKSQEEAIFEDYKGRLYHLNAAQVSALVTKTTPKDVREYILTAKSIIKDLRKYISAVKSSIIEFDDEFSQIILNAQTLPKCTLEQEQRQEENDAILDELF